MAEQRDGRNSMIKYFRHFILTLAAIGAFLLWGSSISFFDHLGIKEQLNRRNLFVFYPLLYLTFAFGSFNIVKYLFYLFKRFVDQHMHQPEENEPGHPLNAADRRK